jgi:hypothetical protein
MKRNPLAVAENLSSQSQDRHPSGERPKRRITWINAVPPPHNPPPEEPPDTVREVKTSGATRTSGQALRMPKATLMMKMERPVATSEMFPANSNAVALPGDVPPDIEPPPTVPSPALPPASSVPSSVRSVRSVRFAVVEVVVPSERRDFRRED